MKQNLSNSEVNSGMVCQIGHSSLVSRNITIFGRGTSVRLEPEMWVALNDIAKRKKCSIHDICGLIYARKKEETSLTAAIRVFLMLYFRAAATEGGHIDAGHGDFNAMKKHARIANEYELLFEGTMKTKQIKNSG